MHNDPSMMRIESALAIESLTVLDVMAGSKHCCGNPVLTAKIIKQAGTAAKDCRSIRTSILHRGGVWGGGGG